MKYLKIALTIFVLIGIGIAIYLGYSKTTEVQNIGLPENQFTRRINQEIVDLSHKTENTFCKHAYDIIKYHIDDYALINRLGVDYGDTLGNNQNQLYLFKTLYSTYVEKFINQADYVFMHNDWLDQDRSFINSEVARLRSVGYSNTLLEENEGADNEFKRILRTLSDYNSEVSFIRTCNNFSFNNLDLAAKFPMSEAVAKINDSKSHLTALGIVRNSDKVRNGLSEIPDKIFKVHERYLTRKLNEWKDFYEYNTTLADYENNLYKVLKDDISSLDNSIYSSNNIDVSTSKSKLLKTLEADHDRAKAYFKNKNQSVNQNNF